MNCQEYRELIEDALDVSLHGDPERRVKRHLEHCEACRTYFETRRAEHVALFRGINTACAELHLPDGFADRLAASVRARQAARRSWRRFSLPRWALIAASLALMVGFVFAATVVVDAVMGSGSGSSALPEEETVGRVDPNAPDSSTLNDALTAPESGGTRSSASESGGTRSVASSEIPLTDTQQSTTDNQLKGEKTMTKRKAAAAALTAAIAAAPLAAANGDEYQFIISGDPVAAKTVNSSESASIGTALVTSTRTSPTAAASLEARYRTFDESVGIKLRTDSPKGMIISVK